MVHGSLPLCGMVGESLGHWGGCFSFGIPALPGSASAPL